MQFTFADTFSCVYSNNSNLYYQDTNIASPTSTIKTIKNINFAAISSIDTIKNSISKVSAKCTPLDHEGRPLSEIVIKKGTLYYPLYDKQMIENKMPDLEMDYNNYMNNNSLLLKENLLTYLQTMPSSEVNFNLYKENYIKTNSFISFPTAINAIHIDKGTFSDIYSKVPNNYNDAQKSLAGRIKFLLDMPNENDANLISNFIIKYDHSAGLVNLPNFFFNMGRINTRSIYADLFIPNHITYDLNKYDAKSNIIPLTITYSLKLTINNLKISSIHDEDIELKINVFIDKKTSTNKQLAIYIPKNEFIESMKINSIFKTNDDRSLARDLLVMQPLTQLTASERILDPKNISPDAIFIEK